MKLFSLLTSEDSHSPANRQKHICGVNNLIEEIFNIIKTKKRNVRLLNIIYNLLAAHVKLLKLKGNTPQKNTKKNTYE